LNPKKSALLIIQDISWPFFRSWNLLHTLVLLFSHIIGTWPVRIQQ
jgi:hypothetical protein